jgi:AcrR family transcriptional regulator
MVYAVKLMPRPRSLTHAAIATAALAVIDRDGLAALSMRTVAGELGMGTMSLYRYVTDREELERLVVDEVLGTVDVAFPAQAAWSTRVTILTERIRDAVGAHAAVVPLLMMHRHSSRGVLRCAEAFLAALTAGGFAGTQRVIALRTLVSYLNGALQAQHLGPLGGTGTVAMTKLPESEYPLLAATARVAGRVRPDEEFRAGLGVVIRGLRAMRTGARGSGGSR